MDAWTSPNHQAFVAWTVHLEHWGHMLTFLLNIVKVAEVSGSFIFFVSDANICLSLTQALWWLKHFRRCSCDLGSKIRYVLDFDYFDCIYLIVIQILAVNADNTMSNDTQTTALAQMENSFEEVNRACCFNHTLQLSGKTLLKPFNAGMSSAKMAVEENELQGLNDDIPTLLDDDADDSEGVGGSGEGDLDDDKPEDDNNDEIEKLDQLDGEEHEKILANMAVVQQTVIKVCINPF